MAGHNKWAQIKHQKGIADQKRGQLFSKLLAGIAVAARDESNPNFNPRLRDMIEKAKAANIPQENIERAVQRAKEKGEVFEEIIMEAYGPGGIAILIEAITDNKNRTIPEVKKILSELGGKWAEAGSVRWVFNEKPGRGEQWRTKFPQLPSPEDSQKITDLVTALEKHADVQKVSTNAIFK